MANLISIARPYATAAFEYAKQEHALPKWQSMLEAASALISNDEVQALLLHPELTNDQALDILFTLLAPHLNESHQHFLKLLVLNKRLLALPDVLALFNTAYQALEKISVVRVVTSIETNEAYRNQLKEALSKRMQQDVTLIAEIDPSIIGGAIIHIGDKVIDGSIRGKLSRLHARLTA